MNTANIDSRKIALIEEFKRIAKTTPSKDLLPLVLAISKKAQSLNINFSKEEINSILDSMKPNMTPNEISQMQMIMNFIK